MAGQTTYSVRPTAVGIPGQLSCPEQIARLDSKENAAAIPAGVWVARDGSDTAVKVPAASGDVTSTGCGFVKADVARQRAADGTSTYQAKEGLTVMREGRMFVLSETALNYGDAVYARITASGGNTQLGKVRNDDDSGKAVAIPGCRCIRTITGAGLTEVELLGSGAAGAVGATGATGPTP